MIKTAILMANGVEECEALLVVDLLRRADITIEMVSIEDELQVTGGHDITITCDSLLSDFEVTDEKLLIIPGGGSGVENLQAHEGVSRLLEEFRKNQGDLAAICAGPAVLDKLNLLEGKQVTIYPSWREKLNNGIDYLEKPVVEDDWLVTGQALGAAIPFALKLIERLRDRAAADKVAESIYY